MAMCQANGSSLDRDDNTFKRIIPQQYAPRKQNRCISLSVFALSGWQGSANQDTSLYFPTQSGVKRAYVSKGMSGPIEIVEMIEISDKSGENYKCSVRLVPGSGKPAAINYEVSPQGITVLNRPGGVKATPSECLLKLPYKEGEAWTETHTTVKGTKWTVKKTIGKKEIINVPAGRFLAISVKSEATNGEKTIREENWYAPELVALRLVRMA